MGQLNKMFFIVAVMMISSLTGCAINSNSSAMNVHYTKQQEQQTAKAYAFCKVNPNCSALLPWVDEDIKKRKVQAASTAHFWQK